MSEEETWTKLLRYVGHWSLLGFGYCLVEEKATGEFVGGGRIRELQAGYAAIAGRHAEGGMGSGPGSARKGLCYEAVRAATSWGEMRFRKARTACIIHPEHAASIHVAEKRGYRNPKLASYKGEPVLLFVREPQGLKPSV